MIRGLHFGVWWDLSTLPSTSKAQEGLSPGRTQGRSAGGCSQRRRGNYGGAPLPAPSRSLLPGPTVAAWGLGGCQTLRSTGVLGFSEVRKSHSVPLPQRLLQGCEYVCAAVPEPRGPWPLGDPCVVRARRSPWRHMGPLSGSLSCQPPPPPPSFL